jgi:hypothetical protein
LAHLRLLAPINNFEHNKVTIANTFSEGSGRMTGSLSGRTFAGKLDPVGYEWSSSPPVLVRAPPSSGPNGKTGGRAEPPELDSRAIPPAAELGLVCCNKALRY